MARPSSSKKIQRAARAAATSRGARERRELGFPIALVLVVVLGVAMVVVARASRAPAVAPQISDHWHSAYGVYDCDRFVEPFLSASDPDGIHSHRDGVIHIHPWNSSATGTDASLKVFFESMGVRVTDDEISGPGIGVLEAGSDCGGEPTIIRVARFGLSAGAGEAVDFDSVGELRDLFEITEEFTDDFGDVRLLADGEAFTIARVPPARRSHRRPRSDCSPRSVLRWAISCPPARRATSTLKRRRRWTSSLKRPQSRRWTSSLKRPQSRRRLRLRPRLTQFRPTAKPPTAGNG